MAEYIKIKGLWGEFRKSIASLDDSHLPKGLEPVFDTTREVYDIVVACGGFLAGGLPRFIASQEFRDPPTVPACFQAAVDRGKKLSMADRFFSYIVSGGDLDFFFPTKERCDAAIALVGARMQQYAGDHTHPFKFDFSESMCNNAINLKFGRISWDHPIKAQFIKCRFSDVIGTLDDFDLVNSRVAVVGDDVIMDSNWLDLEKERKLHLDRTNSPFCIGRIKKYCKKYGYKSITPESSRLLVSKVSEYHAALLADPKTYYFTPPGIGAGKHQYKITYSHESLASDVRQIIDIINQGDLQALFEIYSSMSEQKQICKKILHRINGDNTSAVYHEECDASVPDELF